MTAGLVRQALFRRRYDPALHILADDDGARSSRSCFCAKASQCYEADLAPSERLQMGGATSILVPIPRYMIKV